MAISAATPMKTPSMVSALRNLLARSAAHAVASVIWKMDQDMAEPGERETAFAAGATRCLRTATTSLSIAPSRSVMMRSA